MLQLHSLLLLLLLFGVAAVVPVVMSNFVMVITVVPVSDAVTRCWRL